jgi:Na+-transporting NADH:ubiquinone oxidoreductase subunit NqrA
LEEAIEFFRIALGRDVKGRLGRYFDSSIVNAVLIRQVLTENTEIAKGMGSQEFCEFAILTLRTLLKTPKRVSQQEVLRVHDFFCTTELIVDRILENLRSPSLAVSLAS